MLILAKALQIFPLNNYPHTAFSPVPPATSICVDSTINFFAEPTFAFEVVAELFYTFVDPFALADKRWKPFSIMKRGSQSEEGDDGG